MFDNTSTNLGDMVLNLFIFDEEGNEITDEAMKDNQVNDEAKEGSNIIDINNYSSDLSEYLADDKPLEKSVQEFFKKKLQNKNVNTVIGDVHILGSSWRNKLKFGVKTDELRAKSIPKIPEILKTGEYEGRSELDKVRKDSYVAFHSFIKHEVKIDDIKASVRLLVGERANKQLEFVVYSIYPNTMVDSASLKNPGGSYHGKVTKAPSGLYNSLSKDEDEVNVFDGMGHDGWNIEIIKVVDEHDIMSQPTNDYSASNPYAAYAQDDEDAKKNADDWEQRKPLTESMLASFNAKAQGLGFSIYIEDRHHALGKFQADKAKGERYAQIFGEFKNHGSDSVLEAARDFTVEMKQGENVADYFYTNDIDEALQKAEEWVAEEAALVLTGNEFGEFDDTPEGLAELRKVAIKHLEDNLKNKVVECPALSSIEDDIQVQIRQRGIDHIKSFSADKRKLLLLAQIVKLIQSAKYLYSAQNTKSKKKPNIEAYHYLHNTANIGGESLEYVLVIEKDQEGLLHYDILTNKYAKTHLEQVKKIKLDNTVPEKNLGYYQALDSNYQKPDAESSTYDGVGMGAGSADKVLNLFVFDAKGNEIETAEAEDKSSSDEVYDADEVSYLEDIINGVIKPLDVDMDKIIAMGEKDDTNEQWLKALEMVTAAESDATAEV